MNPNTGTCPIFRSKRDAELNKMIYKRNPPLALSEAGGASWDIKVPQGLYHQTNDADFLRTRDELCTEGLSEKSPVGFSTGSVQYHTMYEGRMIHFFDHGAASVGFRSDLGALRTGTTIDVSESQKNDPNFLPSSRFMVPQIDSSFQDFLY